MKPRVQSVTSEEEQKRQNSGAQEDHRQEPLSGSKKVKNRQHSRHNHGEGS
jgi:small acid-soluble spore protein P (minor)